MSETSYNIKEPGLNVLPPGVERYVVNGGGINVLQILPEDKIEIINDEGKQICEIIVFNSKGKNDLSILNLKENSNGDYLKKAINNDEKILNLFKKKNLELNKSKSSIIFNEDCPMGEKIIIKSKDECIVMIASPGAKMNVHNQNPPTSLTIFLHRAKFEIKKEQYVLPEPLYDPNSEKFIKRMTAETYDVKEGDYIQIIDTSGRQCSRKIIWR